MPEKEWSVASLVEHYNYFTRRKIKITKKTTPPPIKSNVELEKMEVEVEVEVEGEGEGVDVPVVTREPVFSNVLA